MFHEEETLSRGVVLLSTGFRSLSLCFTKKRQSLEVLGLDHSMKSADASSSRSDTKVVSSMRKGVYGMGWAAPSCCSLLRWKSVFFLLRRPGMVPTTARSWS